MNKHLIWALALLLAACGTETGTIETNSARINRVIPVVQTAQVATGTLALADIQSITYPRALEGEGRWLKTFLHDYLDYHGPLEPDTEWQGGKAIQLLFNPAMEAPEAYRVTVDASGVRVEGATGQGVFYGLQTLVQLLPNQEGDNCELPNFPFCTIDDAPRFAHRGLLLDCCRHFMEPEFVKRTIDHLAFYKMNVLHWHLTEDQGWRIEIKKYPRLTEHGAWREGEDGEPYGGFYTQDQIRDIVDYAAERHVEIIPEIELPGHSSAAISAYPHLGCTGDSIDVVTEWGVFPDVYCAGNDSTVAFLKDVMDEVVQLFPSTYVHIGGDEAPVSRWEECDKCQARIQTMGLDHEHALQGWLISEIGHHLAGHGKTIIGWDEILEAGDLPETAIVQSWRGMEGGVEAVQHGHPAIMSPTSHCYFDYPLSSTDLPEVFAFDPIPTGLTASEAALIRGGECNMWTERAPQSVIESKIYPRLLGMSEVLWRQDSTARDYDTFHRALEAHYPLLDHMGVDYGFEQVPVSFSLTPDEESLSLNVLPVWKEIEVSWIKSDYSDDYSEVTVDSIPLDELHYDVEGVMGFSVQAEFRGKKYPELIGIGAANHLGIRADMSLKSTPSPYYPAGGENALADGRWDPLQQFRAPAWQGFNGEDLVVEYDFGERIGIGLVSASFLEYTNAWIFFPEKVSLEYSEDGEKWFPLLTGHNYYTWNEMGYTWRQRKNTADRMEWEEPQYRGMYLWGDPAKALYTRYLRLTAKSMGICPEGHPAAGQPAWTFADEIIIKGPLR